MHVDYIGTARPKVTVDDMRRNQSCSRLINGLSAEENCCDRCRALIHSSRPIEYAIRDRFGRVITNWLFS